jgi:hypothetical protein
MLYQLCCEILLNFSNITISSLESQKIKLQYSKPLLFQSNEREEAIQIKRQFGLVKEKVTLKKTYTNIWKI